MALAKINTIAVLLALGFAATCTPVVANYLETGIVVVGITDEVVGQYIAYHVTPNPADVLVWFTR